MALGGACVQMQLLAMHNDPRPDNIRKVRQLGAHHLFAHALMLKSSLGRQSSEKADRRG
jgi:hypothetical protein